MYLYMTDHIHHSGNLPQLLQRPHIVCFDTEDISFILLKCSSASVN